MAWEQRGGQQYLYKSVRQPNGKVRKVYLGRAGKAELAEEEKALNERKRLAEQMAADEIRLSFTRLDALSAELDERVDALVTFVLSGAGFHQHHSTWRQRREKKGK